MDKVRMTLNNGMTMDMEVYPDVAPISADNFLNLVDKHFYDGICFHRIIKGFMAQVGGYKLDLDKMELYEVDKAKTIKGEFNSNGFKNDLKHTRGVLSMARTMVKDSASSQIFICTADAPHLDGEYAAFGKVLDDEASQKTLSYLDDAVTVNVGGGLTDFPYPPVIIEKMERI